MSNQSTDIRGAPYHPMTQGKIERFHRSLKHVIRLDNYYLPWHLERAIAQFSTYYNQERYHESIGNVTPADMYHGRAARIQSKREEIRHKTMNERRRLNRQPSRSLIL